MAKLMLALSVALVVLAVRASAACPSNAAAVGFAGPLTMIDHGISGTVKVNSDTSFTVTNFNYDGQAPAVHWWGTKGLTRRDLRGGVELDPTQIVTPRVNTIERVTIKPNLCLSNFTHIVVWCEVAQADFGHLALPSAGMSMSGSAMAPMASATGRKMLGNL
ncbi:hypothetical protein WJX81_000687 [Elliptochloris bilobata]|uniref:DM13 domain-containing protein n=1 Tax=Elliptochloris bilobata TaxID=381761 RepID=A0AAW1RUL6_9CHLO